MSAAATWRRAGGPMMPSKTRSRPCTICDHPARTAIDRARVAGEVMRHVAERFAMSFAALQRHKAHHLADLLADAKQRQDQARDAHVAAVGVAVQDRARRRGGARARSS